MRSVEEGVEETRRCWAAGYNCAESVLRGVCFAQGVELGDQCARMATPFGGGIGRAEDVCGALTGGVLGVGIVLGRTAVAEDKVKSYDAAGILYKSFKERFGSVDCKVLNMSDFKSPEHRPRCGRFVEEATRLAETVLRGR